MKFLQFVPGNYCLRCDVCCRFKDEVSAWAPNFSDSEKDPLIRKNVVSADIFSKNKIRLKPHPSKKDLYVCPCFEVSSNSCRIYRLRPFECVLYPFLVANDKGRLVLCADHTCPYLSAHFSGETYDTYYVFLEKFFKDRATRKFLKKNSSMFSSYESGLPVIFEIAPSTP